MASMIRPTPESVADSTDNSSESVELDNVARTVSELSKPRGILASSPVILISEDSLSLEGFKFSSGDKVVGGSTERGPCVT